MQKSRLLLKCPSAKEPVDIKSICPIFDGDNIKNDESKRKSHVLKLHGAHLSSTKVNRYHMWSWYPSRQGPLQHTDPPHGSGFLQLRKANQNQDKKRPHHLLLPACEESTKITKQPQIPWLFSIPLHEIVLSLCRNHMD